MENKKNEKRKDNKLKEYNEKKESKEQKEKKIRYGLEEVGEDETKYGEFVSSYFAWVTPKQQKKKVEELEHIADVDKDK